MRSRNGSVKKPSHMETSCCHVATSDRGYGRSRGCVQTKTFRKNSEASSRTEGGRGYVIIFNNEPSCCYVATSERRRTQSKANYNCIALREASVRHSQLSNSEAALFRGTLPRRYSIRRSQRCNTSNDTIYKLLLRRNEYCLNGLPQPKYLVEHLFLPIILLKSLDNVR